MTWEGREFRILMALGRLEGTRPPGADIDIHDIAQEASIDKDDAIRGVLALREGGFVEAKSLAGDDQILAVHGIGLLAAGRRVIGQWPSRESIEGKRAQRLLFMRHLYSTTKGRRLDARAANQLGDELGWTPDETDLITDYLFNEGLIDFAGGGDGGQIVITHLGILEVEQSLASPKVPTEHFPAASSVLVVHGDVSNSQIQVGTVASHQIKDISIEEIRALEAFIDRLETDLPSLGLNRDQISNAKADMATIRAQLKSPKPKRRILKESLITLRSIAEGVTGNAAFTALVEAARHIQL